MPPVGRKGSGADLELCDECADRLTRFVALPPDCEAVDFRAIPLSCPACQSGMLALIGAAAAQQRSQRRTPEEQRAFLADFKARDASAQFHQHLDGCKQCSSQPFRLCIRGELLLLATRKGRS